MVRAKTVQTHSDFIRMIRELILERANPGLVNPSSERRAVGLLGPREDVCADHCCPAPLQPEPATPEIARTCRQRGKERVSPIKAPGLFVGCVVLAISASFVPGLDRVQRAARENE
jgi:hypothetical protein